MVTCVGHLKAGLHFPIPSTPIFATNVRGLEGVVDIRPLRILSSYDPTKEPNGSSEFNPNPEESLRVGLVTGPSIHDSGTDLLL